MGHRIPLLLLGDSITQQSFSTPGGWGASLQNWYQRTGDVYNRGLSGYNSRWLLYCLSNPSYLSLPSTSSATPYSILDHPGFHNDSGIITLFLGANDASYDCPLGSEVTGQHVPPDEFHANILSIIQHLATALSTPKPPVILVTPGPVSSSSWPTRSQENLRPYAESIRAIAADKNLPLVDLWAGPDALTVSDLSDGLHLSPSGSSKVFKSLQATIRSSFPHLAPDDKVDGFPNVELCMPHWSVLAGVGT
eukprot:CAMPEP_0182469270 /NCGR_PEP_ID=MMETSP1319-20130603/16816_1 /TAXON_ID=172717 /ORGANISM="Bolidomonas pacifica, Strain RCC208" /LENGTH=249 /DNA_ID=CAMNT_0024669553 /DNA_START=46 /DNA_END=792 /DNA_ORIENTATION=-